MPRSSLAHFLTRRSISIRIRSRLRSSRSSRPCQRARSSPTRSASERPSRPDLSLAQKWTEGRRRILVITPANLRKQWSQEIEEKFFLPTIILEATNYNKHEERRRAPSVRTEDARDLLVPVRRAPRRRTDGHPVGPRRHRRGAPAAERLSPRQRIGRTLKGALANAPKVLLTATPLQNSLMELYGLVSLIDDYAFGDAKSFRSQYARLRRRRSSTS